MDGGGGLFLNLCHSPLVFYKCILMLVFTLLNLELLFCFSLTTKYHKLTNSVPDSQTNPMTDSQLTEKHPNSEVYQVNMKSMILQCELINSWQNVGDDEREK